MMKVEEEKKEIRGRIHYMPNLLTKIKFINKEH